MQKSSSNHKRIKNQIGDSALVQSKDTKTIYELYFNIPYVPLLSFMVYIPNLEYLNLYVSYLDYKNILDIQ